MKVIKRFSVTINCDRWNVYLYSNKDFAKLYPDALACTHYVHGRKIRNIYFSRSGVTHSTIWHELMHAYLSYRNFYNKHYIRVEEDICDAIGKIHKRLNYLTQHIYAELNDA